VYGYGNVAKPDNFTARFKTKFDHYRNIRGVSDEKVAGLIEEDKIDILVEIGGHVGDNRLPVLAYKPAPVQVDYGGFNTTGMQAVDYRLTDNLADLPESQKFYTEELVYLPGGLTCYAPPDFAPSVTALPALRKAHITFGVFNNNMKINPYTMSLWAEILKANSNSRLLMKLAVGNDQGMKDKYLGRFEQLGINRERVEICGWKAPVEHLKLYGEIDIALDSYPYNGGVTTLEGLWMGVPIVSLVGSSGFLSRVGLSILSRVGLESFAVLTPTEYVEKAVSLAENLETLAEIRASMRERMTAGVLCDAKTFARSVEAAYRKMWHRWCQCRNVVFR
jgi:predicted O-linked N-acetylglucosamine transferase (SPINDLY family)